MMDHARKLCVLLISAVFATSTADGIGRCEVTFDIPAMVSLVLSGPYQASCMSYVQFEILDKPNNISDMAISVTNPVSENLFRENVGNCVELTLVNGDLKRIPEEVYTMNRLVKLTITRNEIGNVNLYKCLTMSSLKNIGLGNNQITVIESDDDVSIYNSSVKSIDLSHNLIEVVPDNFVKPFRKLERLNLSHNKISSISLNAFEGIVHLETLDISNNILMEVGNVFPKLPKLRDLSLSNNKLTKLPDSNFVELTNLENLDASSNMINHIGLLTFEGLVKLKSLDMSNNKLTKVGYAFSSMDNLLELNIARNNIVKILAYNFVALTKLKTLDISFNNIPAIASDAFQTLTSLQVLDLAQNEIETISKDMFATNANLTWLSLLNNHIEVIEPYTFRGKHIDTFFIQNNKLTGAIASGSFSGINDPELDLSVGNITSIGDEAFDEMAHLKYLNLSTNAIHNISYLAFSSLVSLQVLDLSYNKLEILDFETDSLKNVYKLHAHHNNIENIVTSTFANFVSLQELDLSYNDIKAIEPHQFLNKLTYLDLSSNEDMNIIGDPFGSITRLNKLLLQNVRTGISFENSSTSVTILEMQSCGIIDINLAHIYNVENVVYLNLSMNEIATIDRNSFKSMPLLENLDLSLNEITLIHPGTFLRTKALNIINLYGNSLKAIPYGVFDGLDVLSELNLAKNVLSRYDIRFKPIISKLSLDDNNLTNFNFKELFSTKTSQLTIGGNQIPCDVFAEMKYSNYSEKFKSIVTAKTLNYYAENINGISCQNGPNDTSIVPVTPNSGININPLTSLLETIARSLEKISENTRKTETSLKDLIESSNNALNANNEKLTNITNQLELIKKVINDEKSSGTNMVVLPVTTDAPNVLNTSGVTIQLLPDNV